MLAYAEPNHYSVKVSLGTSILFGHVQSIVDSECLIIQAGLVSAVGTVSGKR